MESKSSFEPVPKAEQGWRTPPQHAQRLWDPQTRKRANTHNSGRGSRGQQGSRSAQQAPKDRAAEHKRAGKQASKQVDPSARANAESAENDFAHFSSRRFRKAPTPKTGNPVHALPCLTIGGYWAKPSETKATPTASRRDIEHKVFKAKAVLVQSGSVVASCAEAGPVQ